MSRRERDDPSQENEDEEENGREQAHKRARTQDQIQEEFKKGTVKKIRVHNFMTYAGTVTISPGPRLNLVLGPNGTGKSSLVCALCVGLAGSTKLLGRADNLSDYVRRNCDRCWTEITLSGGPGRPDIVIHRKITVEHYTEEGQRKRRYNSEYKINGASARQEAVKDKVKELNIQFDNLCQFLPQDKVVEFARMGPQELLVATEKAIGDSTLHDTHCKLTELRTEMKGKEGDVQRAQKGLERLMGEQEQQRREYERFKQREALKEQARQRRMKVDLLKAKAARDEEKEFRAQARETAQQLEKLEQDTHGDQEPIKKYERSKDAAGKARDQVKAAVSRAHGEVTKMSDELEEARQEVEANLEQQRSLKARSVARADTIAQFRREIRDLEAQLATLPQHLAPEFQARLQQFHDQLRQTQETEGRLSDEQGELQREARAQDHRYNTLSKRHEELSNVRTQKLDAYMEGEGGRRHPRLRDVLAFINNNRAQFKGPVYGPLLLEVNIKPASAEFPGSHKWSSYVEKHCGFLMSNFVTSCRDDERLLSQFLKEHRINLVVAAVTHDFSAPVPHPLGEPAEFRQYGITHTLDQLIEAPNLVKHMLADLAKINRVYVGDATTTRNIDNLFKHTRVQTVYAEEQKVSSSVSRYNRDASNMAFDGVPPARLLSTDSLAGAEREQAALAGQMQACNLDRQRVRNRLQQVETELQGVQTTRDVAGRGIQEIEAKRAAIQQRFAKCQFDLTSWRKRLAAKENEPDPLDESQPLERQKEMLLNVLAKKGAKLVALTNTYWQVMRKYMAAELTFRDMETKLAEMYEAAKRQQSQLKEARQKHQRADAAWQAAKERYMIAKEQLSAHPPLTDELKLLLRELSDEIQTLEEEALQQEAAAHAITCNNDRVMQEFETRQKEIDRVQEQVKDLEGGLAAQQAHLDQLQAEWLPPLQELVGEISTRFEANFAHMGCAGEVKLVEHADFDKYSIQIWVKFRNSEPMQLLTANRQSGGERSVATILYLIALQGVTETPFRVVDEINQGMDPSNERKVFMQLVESSCQPDTPQCFLLTPKLLPDLPFAPEITVLNIMNGAGIDKPVIAEFDARVSRGGPAGQLHALLGSRWQAHLQAMGVAG